MIREALEYQTRQLEEAIDAHTQSLVRGAGSRDDDQRIRGIIHGLKLGISIIQEMQEKLRKAEGEDAAE